LIQFRNSEVVVTLQLLPAFSISYQPFSRFRRCSEKSGLFSLKKGSMRITRKPPEGTAFCAISGDFVDRSWRNRGPETVWRQWL